MMKRFSRLFLYGGLLALFCGGIDAVAQPRYDKTDMVLEHLNRGVVAVRKDSASVVVSWRTLPTDSKGEAFDIYRNGEKLNAQPITTGGTFFVDDAPLSGDATYEVRSAKAHKELAVKTNISKANRDQAKATSCGSYTLRSDAPIGYLSIPLSKPADGTTPDGRTYFYTPNDASVGDVDGDGQYEIFLLWAPSNSRDNAHGGFTGSTIIDCYRLDGEQLWRIDLGRNIRSGAHYVPFVVYDFDGDGRAELMMKTADGTVDGQGRVIGDAAADWRTAIDKTRYNTYSDARIRPEYRPEYRPERRSERRPERRSEQAPSGRRRRGRPNTMEGRVLAGPEYLTVFNGLTGAAMSTVDYLPNRGEGGKAWGDNRGNRSERYLACAAYLDGKRASAVFCRGYYHGRTAIVAWNWDGEKLTEVWNFDTLDPQWRDYDGQGFHNLSVGDVDGDGKDEIVYGSMVVDHDGQGLYATGLGHGDAMHMTAFDPASDKLQVWTCHENRRDGSVLRDAATGEVIFQIKSNKDVGRAMAADIDPTNYGVEMWTLDSRGVRTFNGDVLTDSARLSTNFAVWWDGDLLRELLNGNAISKYDWTTGEARRIKRFDGAAFNNGSKSNPCLSADIIGDWREEVLVRSKDNTELRLYVSPLPTDHRIDCLMSDVVYRLGVASQNVGYNQPPHTSYYLGPDKDDFLK